MNKFLQSSPNEPKQIISLGAGSDTRYFRIISQNPSQNICYHELDFPANTSVKITTIQRVPRLLSLIRSKLSQPEDLVISPSEGILTSSSYNIHPIDLRTLASDSPPEIPNLSSDVPTLVISECCLIYLTPSSTTGILRSLTQHYIPSPTPLALVIYEPIRPNDAFGRTMVSNLATRGIVLETLQAHPSLEAQCLRLRNAGFGKGQLAADTAFIFNKWVDETEKERVAGLEMLDELEEWTLLAQHYCVAWGWRQEDDDIFGKAWQGIEGQRDRG